MTSLRLYVAGAVLIAMLGLGCLALWFRAEATRASAERDKAIADLGTAIDANRVQQETIGRLQASAAANDRIMAQMADQLASINAAVAETNQQIGDLKDANQDVRAYLNTLVPGDLRLLLDR